MTDREQAEKALRESEQRYRTLAENCPVGIWHETADHEPIYVNPAMCAMLGVEDVEELAGENRQSFFTPQSLRTAAREDAKRLLGLSSSYEVEVVAKDGRHRNVFVHGSPLLSASGELLGTIATFVDITELKRADEALKASEANYRAIFNAANDAIFVHDLATGEILDVNERMCEMYGYTPDEARRINVEALSAGEPPYTQTDALRRIQQAVEGRPQIFEWLAKDKAGRFFWVEVNLKRATIGGKERLLAIVRDITERKRAEEERRQLETQIQRAQKLDG